MHSDYFYVVGRYSFAWRRLSCSLGFPGTSNPLSKCLCLLQAGLWVCTIKPGLSDIGNHIQDFPWALPTQLYPHGGPLWCLRGQSTRFRCDCSRLVPGTQRMGGENWLLRVVLWSPRVGGVARLPGFSAIVASHCCGSLAGVHGCVTAPWE